MKEGEKFYGFTVDKETWKKFREELIKRDLYFEPSGCYNAVHVEVLCTPTMAIELDRMEI